MAEAVHPEVEALREAEVVERAPVGPVPDGPGDPVGRMHHAPDAHHVGSEALAVLHAAVADDDLAAREALGHQRQPAVRLRHGVGRGEDQVFVVRRLDTHVERHLARNGETGVKLDLGREDLREGTFQLREVLVEVRVVTHVDDDHLEDRVVLGQNQRQALLDETVVLGEERHHDRDGWLLAAGRRTAAVAVARNPAVDTDVIVELHAEHDEHRSCQSSPLPAVARQKSIVEVHIDEICAKIRIFCVFLPNI